MLGAGEEIAPDLGGRLDVRISSRLRREVVVREPGVPSPVLRRRVGVEDPRHAPLRPQPVEEALPPPRGGVRLGLVGEREAVPEARGRLHRGLSVAVVELAPPPPRDMDVHPVEHRLARLVPVEPGVEEGPEEPAALRDPLRDSRGRCARRPANRRSAASMPRGRAPRGARPPPPGTRPGCRRGRRSAPPRSRPRARRGPGRRPPRPRPPGRTPTASAGWVPASRRGARARRARRPAHPDRAARSARGCRPSRHGGR